MRGYFKTEKVSTKTLKGQGALIMNNLGSTAEEAKSVETLANVIAEKLITRQDPKRVVMFYMSIWAKDGYVSHVDLGNTTTTPHMTVRETMASAIIPMPEVPAKAATLPDLAGKKLSEAVLILLEFKAKALTEDQIVETFKENGYDFSVPQVRSAAQALVKKDLVTKIDGKIAVVG